MVLPSRCYARSPLNSIDFSQSEAARLASPFGHRDAQLLSDHPLCLAKHDRRRRAQRLALILAQLDGKDFGRPNPNVQELEDLVKAKKSRSTVSWPILA